MTSPGKLRHVTLVRIEVLEERIASTISVKIGELVTLILTSNRSNLLADSSHTDDRGDALAPKRRFLQESHDVTAPKNTFFIVIALKTSNPT
jgi:hypothetical protein